MCADASRDRWSSGQGAIEQRLVDRKITFLPVRTASGTPNKLEGRLVRLSIPSPTSDKRYSGSMEPKRPSASSLRPEAKNSVFVSPARPPFPNAKPHKPLIVIGPR